MIGEERYFVICIFVSNEIQQFSCVSIYPLKILVSLLFWGFSSNWYIMFFNSKGIISSLILLQLTIFLCVLFDVQRF